MESTNWIRRLRAVLNLSIQTVHNLMATDQVQHVLAATPALTTEAK
jgi:hypothetical protein